MIRSIAKQIQPAENTMNVHPILKKTMSLVTPDMHSRRRCALTDAIDSLLNGASATVTALGRGIASPAK
ncbi:hypothetical protein, partial [Methylophaga sulfidovorans]